MINPRLLFALALIAPGIAFAASPYKVEWVFTGGTDGNMPYGEPLVLAGTNGGVYGTTAMGGSNNLGVVYRIEPYGSGPKQTTLWSFTGGADGSLPVAGLIADRNGNLFGTTAMDGNGLNGTVFKISPPATSNGAWSETTLWSFTGGEDGGTPVSMLLADRSGKGVIYGTTRFGGANNLGTIFALTPPSAGSNTWTETVLWSFTGGLDGSKPVSQLYQDAKGVLYGTALEAGSGNAGVAFELVPPASSTGPWNFEPIWSFSGGSDGANPASALRADASGNLYGTAEYGGTGTCPQASWPYYSYPYSWTNYALNADYVTAGGNACGVVYELSPPSAPGGAWTQTVLFQFIGDATGANPFAPLFLNNNGTITGTTPLNNFVYPKTIPPVNLFTGGIFTLIPGVAAGDGYTAVVNYASKAKTHGYGAGGGVVSSSSGALYYGVTTYGGTDWTHLIDTAQGVLYGLVPSAP